MTEREALEYEVRSSRLAPWLAWGWTQGLIAKHFARKAHAKWMRYEASKAAERWLNERRNAQG